MLNRDDRSALLDAAAASLRHGLAEGREAAVDPSAYSAALAARGASFVTLKREDMLRGCIGSVEAEWALVEDVVHNAYAAGFQDSRFAPLRADEYDGLTVSISVMGPLEALAVRSEPDLLRVLRPGEDGLVLETDGGRGVFLPQVWENLPDPAAFVDHLKAKAGLSLDPWPARARAFRFSTESFERRPLSA